MIYFYHNETMPLFVLTAYAKNDRADLSQADKNALRKLTETLVDLFERKYHGGHSQKH